MSEQTQQKTSSNRLLLIVILVVMMIVTTGVMFLVFSSLIAPPSTVNTGAAVVDSGAAFSGAREINPPRTINDFTLTSHTGEPMSLSDLHGKATLLYFGYTNCPDVCPITLSEYRRVKQGLGDDADAVNFVMVSVDPKRDTPERLASYLGNFDSVFIGMTGEDGTLRRISVDFDLFYEIHDDGTDNYLVDHTASLFLLNPDGELVTIFTFGTEPEVIIENVQAHLELASASAG